jgi:hypothetical protein
MTVGVAAALVAIGAQEHEAQKLVTELQSGGYVLVMRHASSPRQAPTSATANPDNSKLERQLDHAGREGATAMGDALRAKVTEVPRSGNTLLVTHQPNLSRAFPDWGATVMDGETVVVHPDGKGGFAVTGRIRIEDWPQLK